ncbi:GGDEF domain-containing protein [Duganella aceris]|uniref:Sensor domain-containing diguanylate cyclase n=1 Tax=Duganella aceris TaxID=2703883 RepID=A0ABX0FMU5_9BURK|nr:sensor domain-containing diguanylate cyclase [Duganella aceris]NGZ85896.1 sensor domain-containing diguanylate cyclase [Duganella aceris]
MLAPQTPTNEAQRIHVLHSLGLLDALPDERFDRLTRLAKRLFGVPVAKVTLVDDEAVFALSCAGQASGPVPRALSFCAHAIVNDGVLLVPETRNDPRFHDNPYVTQAPFIRFYAGCPLEVPGGARLGSLCLIDFEPRQFSAEDVSLLRDLAAMVEQEMAAVQMATVDELTTLLNRRGFEAAAPQALQLCARMDKPASLLFFDLNRFKQINDNFGHAEGDRALKVFAETLRKVLRSSDLPGRMGGDEFVALLINSSRDETALVVNRLRTAINERNEADRRGYEICFSVGQVELPPDGDADIARLLAHGDADMYKNKHAMKNNSHQEGT